MPEGTKDLISGQEDEQASSSDQEEAGSKGYVSRSDFEAFQNKLNEQFSTLKGTLEGNRQSQKDVIEDRVSKAVAPLAEDLKQARPLLESLGRLGYLAEGADINKAERELAMEAIVSQALQGNTSDGNQVAASTGSPGGNRASDRVQGEVDRILQHHGLTGDEPSLVEAMKGVKGEPLTVQLRTLEEAAESVSARQKGDAGSLLNVGGGQKRHTDVEALTKEYIREAQTLRGQGMPALRKLQSQYSSRGVPVDRIDLIRGEVKPAPQQ